MREWQYQKFDPFKKKITVKRNYFFKTKEGFITSFITALEMEGIHILWKGILPSYIMVINPIVQFTIYEHLKNHFAGSSLPAIFYKFLDSSYQAVILFVSGAISKVIASFVTYPTQVIRTNMHVYTLISRFKI